MGNKTGKNSKPIPNIKKTKTTEVSSTITTKIHNEILIWLVPNENSLENLLYKGQIFDIHRFELFIFSKIEDCLSKIKEIKFKKTYILINDSLAKEFFIEFDKLLDTILICPIIMIFAGRSSSNIIMEKIFSLVKFPFFDTDLIFNKFYEVKKRLMLEEKYFPNKISSKKENYDNTFTFEYISELKDLIFPLTFIEFMEIPNKIEILGFNQFLLDKYSQSDKMKYLIEQLITEINIPIQILVKYWLRAYTLQTPFYGELNLTLIKKLNNDFDIFIRTLYYGLMKKAIKPLIDEVLYRGSKIKLKEFNYLKESLKNKKENLPGCICYNKAFFSTSLNRETAISFFGKPKEDELNVLFVIKKINELDLENATNVDVQEFSDFDEKEILFFPFSCFEIINFSKKIEKEKEFYEINLSYIGKYKNQIKEIEQQEKIPENNFTKNILESNVLEKLEMNKESNKIKFGFELRKYIPPELKQSYIIAVYDITLQDINKKIQIINCDEK